MKKCIKKTYHQKTCKTPLLTENISFCCNFLPHWMPPYIENGSLMSTSVLYGVPPPLPLPPGPLPQVSPSLHLKLSWSSLSRVWNFPLPLLPSRAPPPPTHTHTHTRMHFWTLPNQFSIFFFFFFFFFWLTNFDAWSFRKVLKTPPIIKLGFKKSAYIAPSVDWFCVWSPAFW